jgi:hypothetical protein
MAIPGSIVRSWMSVSRYPGVVLRRGFWDVEKATFEGGDRGVISWSSGESTSRTLMKAELEDIAGSELRTY